jgi:hypothetical protein
MENIEKKDLAVQTVRGNTLALSPRRIANHSLGGR